jgi:asparagine synthase (glutamine-hydrolysing)
MCGIVGQYARNQCNRPVVERMAAAILHRGPDHTGMHEDGPFCFAMNRLSIIDLAGGNQPMHSKDGAISLIYNGEIYNYRELRAELADKIEFHTSSDTEVVLNGYSIWGEEVFARLNGIFAVAIWHRLSRELLLARDPMGVKPLYIFQDQDSFYFSSELKSFSVCGLVNRADATAIAQFLCTAYVFHPYTALEGVRQVEPGSLMRIDANLQCHMREFRGLPAYRAQPARSVEDWRCLARQQILKAVLRQTVSDVPYGLLLSSGVDSMMILAALHQHGLTQRLQTYTVTYENESFAEHRSVERLAGDWGFSNERVTLTGETVKERLPSLFHAFDNLELLPTCAAIHEVSRMAGQVNRVLLAGNGGDEIFLGYPTYRATNIILRSPLIGLFTTGLRPIAQLAPVSDDYLTTAERIRRFILAAESDPIASHMSWRHIFTRSDLREILAKPLIAELDQLFAPQRQFFEEAEKKGYHGLAKYSYADLRTWLLDHSLMMWDKAGMNASAEIRVPLLDLELVDFALAMPVEVRGTRPGSKSFARALFADVLPSYITDLPKKGFQAPVATWLRGPLGSTFRQLTDALPATFVRPSSIEQLWRDFHDRTQDNSLKLWVLGSLAGWAAAHKVDLGCGAMTGCSR